MIDQRGSATCGSDVSSRGPRRSLAWGVVGVIAQITFMAGWLIAETWQGPRYSSIKYTISDLQAATAPHAWFVISCFAIGGIASFLFAVFGLRPALAKAGAVRAYAPWVLAVSALALGNSFPQIPCRLADAGCSAHYQLNSAGGMTDAIVSSIAFLVLAFTPVFLGPRIAAVAEWRHIQRIVAVARIVLPLSFVVLGIASNGSAVQGLAERVLATVCVLWIGVLAVTLISVARRTQSSHSDILQPVMKGTR